MPRAEPINEMNKRKSPEVGPVAKKPRFPYRKQAREGNFRSIDLYASKIDNPDEQKDFLLWAVKECIDDGLVNVAVDIDSCDDWYFVFEKHLFSILSEEECTPDFMEFIEPLLNAVDDLCGGLPVLRFMDLKWFKTVKDAKRVMVVVARTTADSTLRWLLDDRCKLKASEHFCRAVNSPEVVSALYQGAHLRLTRRYRIDEDEEAQKDLSSFLEMMDRSREEWLHDDASRLIQSHQSRFMPKIMKTSDELIKWVAFQRSLHWLGSVMVQPEGIDAEDYEEDVFGDNVEERINDSRLQLDAFGE